jgi:predicted ATPase with chaperone activity
VTTLGQLKSDYAPASSLMAALMQADVFHPAPPVRFEELGVPETFLDGLLCKQLLIAGAASGRQLADTVCVPFGMVEPRLLALRTRSLVTHRGSAPLNDYVYALTEQGREFAQALMDACSYRGAVPVTLDEYLNSVEAQSIRAEAPKRAQLESCCHDISVEASIFDDLGPAVNAGAGLFLYGEPGNGKTTLAERIAQCFGQSIWIPRALYIDGEIVKLFDASYHEEIHAAGSGIIKEKDFDRRWVKINRPTVMVGGELTLDALEIRHNTKTNVSEAPLQLKSNGGVLLIDDFGRQRMNPSELLNRWIVPLEKNYDFLSLSNGKKIQVPFDQMIIFSTNIDPRELVDEAFLRRISYKIHVKDPSEEEFRHLFKLAAEKLGFRLDGPALSSLIEKHYRQKNRAFRRCHPRDLLRQVKSYCAYNDLPIEIKSEYFDVVCRCYFTEVI